MAFLTELWLPIVLAAVFVFVASSIFHMVLPFHRSDYKKMNNEDAVLESLRTNNVAPGMYMFPCAESYKDFQTPEMQEKWKKGPVGILNVMTPAGFNMGRNLGLWFLYLLLVSVFVAYVARLSLADGAEYLEVFQVTGAVAMLGYCIGIINDSIWKGQRWGTTLKFMFDGAVYALLTAGTFSWLWPEATP